MDSPQPFDRSAETTRLLREVVGGDAVASDQLLPLVYDELHALAQRMLVGERDGHTLQPTALIHEAWLRLVPGHDGWDGRQHFVRVAAKAMRRVLIDHARARGADKRGGARDRITLDEALFEDSVSPEDLLAVDEALERLCDVDAQLAQIVELRVFGGLNHSEIAPIVGVSLRTVERGWRLARAWLIKDMRPEGG